MLISSIVGFKTIPVYAYFNSILCSQVNEEASDKVLEVEQKYSEIRRPVYLRRCDIIKTIPDFWLTAVCVLPYCTITVCMFVCLISYKCRSTWSHSYILCYVLFTVSKSSSSQRAFD